MRARNIKPGFFKNELLGSAEPLLAILFAGLWTLADREGRLEDRPLRVKAEIFPYRESLDVNGMLTELARLDFICRYDVDGFPLIQIKNFRKHQTPHKTEKASLLPEASNNILKNKTTGSASVKTPDNNQTLTAPLPPDSLIPDLLIPDSPRGGEDVFLKKCFDLITEKFPSTKTAIQKPIHDWHASGYDFETQIKPIVDATPLKTGVYSFNYFSNVLAQLPDLKPAGAGEKVKEIPNKTPEENRAWYRKMGIHHRDYNPLTDKD